MSEILHVGAVIDRARGRVSNDLDKEVILARHRELMDGEGEAGKVLGHLFQRGISKQTLDFFKVGLARASERFRYVGYAVPYTENTCGLGAAIGTITGARLCNAVRRPERQVIHTGSTGRCFNHDEVKGAETVVLVDHELDAMSVFQMGIRAVTVWSPAHADSVRVALRETKRVILWLSDADPRRVVDLLGRQRCSVVTTSALTTDEVQAAHEAASELNGQRISANDVMLAVESNATTFKRVVETAHALSRGGIVTLDAFQSRLLAMLDKTTEEVNGKLTGLRGFDKLVNGMRNELRVVTGREGEGKSEFCDWLHAHMAMVHGDPVLVISPENGAEAVAVKHFKRMFGQPITDAKSHEQKEMARKVISEIGIHPIYVMDVHGPVDFALVVDTMRKAVDEHGVKHILLDHWQWFNPRQRVKDDTEAIRGFMRELAPMPALLNAGITMVAQPRHNVPLGVIPGPQDLFGGASVKQGCMTGLSIWRDKDADFHNRTARAVKVTTPTGAKTEITVRADQAYLHVWKGRSDVANTGGAVIDFDRQSATYRDPVEITGTGASLVDDDDMFSFGGR